MADRFWFTRADGNRTAVLEGGGPSGRLVVLRDLPRALSLVGHTGSSLILASQSGDLLVAPEKQGAVRVLAPNGEFLGATGSLVAYFQSQADGTGRVTLINLLTNRKVIAVGEALSTALPASNARPPGSALFLAIPVASSKPQLEVLDLKRTRYAAVPSGQNVITPASDAVPDIAAATSGSGIRVIEDANTPCTVDIAVPEVVLALAWRD